MKGTNSTLMPLSHRIEEFNNYTIDFLFVDFCSLSVVQRCEQLSQTGSSVWNCSFSDLFSPLIYNHFPGLQ